MPKYTEWSDELAKELATPFPPAVVQEMRKGGQKISFVSWVYYVEKLNALVGPQGWSVGEPIMREVSGRLVMAIPVSILGVQKINVGDEREDKADFGTASTNAYAQGLKRTLALFGLGLDQYDKKGVGHVLAANGNGNGGPDKVELIVRYLDKLRLVENLPADHVAACKRALNITKQRAPVAAHVQNALDEVTTIAGVHGITAETHELVGA